MARKISARSGKPFTASSSGPKSKAPRPAKRSRQPGGTSEAYTYVHTLPKRHRTSEQQLSLSRDEAGPASPSRRNKRLSGEDDEEGASDDDMAERIRGIARRIAQDDLEEHIESEESEVDSDEAFEESDEERWGETFEGLDRGKGKGKKGKSKAKEVVLKPAKPLRVNLDEDEDLEITDGGARDHGEDDEDGIEVVGGEDDDEEAEEQEEEDDSEEEDEEEGEDEDEDDADGAVELPSDMSEEEDVALDDLDAFVDSLAAADEAQMTSSALAADRGKKSRKALPLVSGPRLDNADTTALTSGQSLDISELLASNPLLSSSAKALLPAKAKKAPSASTSILKSGTLAAPLPTILQERLDREAAYDKTRDEVQKWGTAMKRIKEAEHLRFPLQAQDRGGVKSSAEVVASFKPQNEHESAVEALLKQAGLTEQGVAAAEDEALQGQDLSLEEMEERRRALRAQRELIFRAEQRAKRVAKIKSRTFRRIARKKADKLRAAGELDLEELERLDPSQAAEEREKAERARAKERATLKHSAKNRFGRETEAFYGAGAAGDVDDRRAAKEEMLRVRDKLTRRIHGQRDGEEESDEVSDDDEEDEDAMRDKAFDQLARLDQNEGTNEGPARKGLMGMKFMQKAEERAIREQKEQEAALKDEMMLFGTDAFGGGKVVAEGSEGEDGEEDDDEDQATMLRVGGNEGRMVFSGPAVAATAGPAVVPSVKEAAAASMPTPSTASATKPSPLAQPASTANPWLVPSASSGPSRKKNNALSASSKAADKSNAAFKKAVRTKAPEVDDDSIEINVNASAVKPDPRASASDPPKPTVQKKRKVAFADTGNDHDDDSDPDQRIEDAQDELLPVQKTTRFQQKDLVAEAFAGDDVVSEFAAEKARQVESDAPETLDTSLPGWGTWSGKGVKKRRPNPQFLVKTGGVEPESRKDFGKTNVIISEKHERKAKPFLVKDLPYPYTSREQYERRFDVPLGSEWNTRKMHQKETLPRVVKKAGAIIAPIRKLF